MMFPKSRPAALGKREKAAAKDTHWRKVSALVKARDRVCRLCGDRGYDVHHIEFRSRGGKDLPDNLIFVCKECHGDIHAHITKTGGTSGNLRIGQWNDGLSTWIWRVA